jgi:hypothetical protein
MLDSRKPLLRKDDGIRELLSCAHQVDRRRHVLEKPSYKGHAKPYAERLTLLVRPCG